MSEKAVPDPGAVGWVQDQENPEFWTWKITDELVEEAPDDGAQYGRESKTWTEIVMPEIPEFVETDPTVPAHVKAISTDDIANWSASYSWGDHGDAGYATMMWVQSNYQPKGDYQPAGDYYAKSEALIPDAHNSYSIGDADTRFTKGYFSQQVYAFGGNSDLWNTAYQWGSHASQGYAKYADNPATFTGAVKATYFMGYSWGIWATNSNLYSTEGAGAVHDKYSIGDTNYRWKDAYFSGSVHCASTTLPNGGGWHSTDATWIRASGSKAVYVSNNGANAIATAGDVVAYYSDERLKDVQGPIENPLDKVDAIDTFYYTHNDIAKSLGYEGDEVQVGVSAQSVKAVMPEVVCRAPVDMDADGGSLTGEDYMTVKYERLVPLLLESIKELRKEIEDLKRGK